ncbi:MAG: helix-hairpin-helix domain-containing protein [Pirellulales bacterium]|nr:helix-hairpin-helix domain-containing protein [Pirellulales bacterium]
MLTNLEIAAAFDQTADLLEFQAANPFRVRAYRNAARLIEDLLEPLAKIASDPARKLTDLDGIGADLAEKIQSLLATGDMPLWAELRSQIPLGVLEILRIPGLGPKKAAALHKELKISSLADLRAACQQQAVRKLKGFGAKTETAILAGLDFVQSPAAQRLTWAEADRIVQELRAYLSTAPGIRQLEFAGSYRRGQETVGDLDILIDTADGGPLMDHLAAFPAVDQVLARGETKLSVRLTQGTQVDLRVVNESAFGAALQYFTGSKQHNVTLRGLAKERGLRVNEYGVFQVTAESDGPHHLTDDTPETPSADQHNLTYLAGKTEADVYASLGLPWIPPELRENRREFTWASEGKLPPLITQADLRGDLHMHTTASDGQQTIAEMAAAARERGLDYICITDHSKRVSMANGLDGPRLLAQWAEIDRINATQPGILILKGVEVDILEAGGLDIEDEFLAQADWVVASVHYGQNQPREQITARILGALANPWISAIAHPTGRLINRRKPYEVDLDAVYHAAAEYGKALELNSNPARLDLDDVACAAAKSRGIPIVISSDAHVISGLDVLRYGILQARRAGLTSADVLNTRPWSQVQKMLKRPPGKSKAKQR